MKRPTTDRRGAVLAFAVLLALGLLVLGHALLMIAESAYVTSSAHARGVTDGARAEAALWGASGAGWESWMDSIPVSGRRTHEILVAGSDSAKITWRRLAAEVWLVTATATASPSGPSHRRRGVFQVMDPAYRMGKLPGVVSVGAGVPSVVGGVISGDTTALATLAGPALGPLGLAAAVIQAEVPVDPLGPVGTPGPVDPFGVCDRSAAWNWGDPDQPLRPCGSFTALRGRSAPLVVDGGEGRVVLFVDGSVTLRSGVVIEGLLVTSGRVRLEGGSTFRGRIVAQGGIEVEAGSAVLGDRGVATAALSAVRPALSARRPLNRGPLPGPG